MAEYTVNFKKIKPNAIPPSKGSIGAAGRDLYACIDDDVRINPHYTVLIPTGIAMQLPRNTFGMLVPRSGLATKESLANINSPGIIDEDYTGEIKVAMHNYDDQVRYIHPGERIAQLVVCPYISYDLFEVEGLEETERGTGGFGSTGKY